MANNWGDIAAEGNDFAPDVLADEALGFEFMNGTVRITFGVVKMTDPVPPSDVKMVVVGRLCMGADSAQRFAIGLFDYLKKQGFDPNQNLSGDDAKPN